MEVDLCERWPAHKHALARVTGCVHVDAPHERYAGAAHVPFSLSMAATIWRMVASTSLSSTSLRAPVKNLAASALRRYPEAANG